MLPNLPRQVKKREADFGIRFRRWIEQNPRGSAAYELKQVEGPSMPFSDVQDHQIAALMMAKSKGGILWKIADDSCGQKPFDYFYLKKEPAYIVIKYPDFFCIIDVEAFVVERDKSTRKSLTDTRAREISIITVKL